jgi:hypothetical protein
VRETAPRRAVVVQGPLSDEVPSATAECPGTLFLPRRPGMTCIYQLSKVRYGGRRSTEHRRSAACSHVPICWQRS